MWGVRLIRELTIADKTGVAGKAATRISSLTDATMRIDRPTFGSLHLHRFP